ncbi:MAG: metal ABC transporter substrate-binding protein [Dehalococcoidales bacterium]|nr:metal ABC transporter substrate-binding protein [Dehalococcoidales bacterium]
MRKYLLIILVLCLTITPLISGCQTEITSNVRVVTSTTLISQITERVGGDLVEVINIIPPAQCPGHFDVKPGDIQKLADADLFLLHGWQGEVFSEELIASADNPDLTVINLNIMGNWIVPSIQLLATDEITTTLCQIDAENSVAYQERATEYKNAVMAKGIELADKLAQEDLANINVMCSDQLSGFIQWAGLNIIATYGSPETLTPQVVQALVDKGKQENVVLIIDNLQSGQDAGAGLAEELGCSRIVVTNIPGGFDNTETWEKAVSENVRRILEAVDN